MEITDSERTAVRDLIIQHDRSARYISIRPYTEEYLDGCHVACGAFLGCSGNIAKLTVVFDDSTRAAVATYLSFTMPPSGCVAGGGR